MTRPRGAAARGVFPAVPAVRAATIRDVAKRAGVSVSTVSRVVSGTGYVNADTRRLVEKAIAELGYVPSASARGLVARRTGTLGLCLPDAGPAAHLREPARTGSGVELITDDGTAPGGPAWGSLYFGEVVRGAEFAAWQAGLSVIVAVARPPEAEARARDLAGRVDGLIVVAGTLPDDVVEHVAHRVPVVLVAGPRPAGGYDHVGVDNARGVQVLVEHLVRAHGIRDVRYVAGRAGTPDDIGRFRGFRAAMRALGLPVPAEPALRGDFSRATGRRLARGLLAEHRGGRSPMPGALVCANDETALGFLDVLTAEGFDVPGDVALTGFDGIDGGRTSSPRLTTVEQPMTGLGRLAVDVLRACLADPRLPRQDLLVPVRVLLRESCGTH
ncbi:LacI family DNA-binding transcriptional regulator [Streptomyces litchfieldiae]|uniref:LacI family DNA-binding transcriptional regulator n=1 Tax=Streptomyces litchfieldiae TaxID=3075543 RepID=A0ABU2N0T6_9ACTN|nr:LacI family DNA-binding transcriptional regulator [Streptomyces sp. DSM 44938]MDT0346934.1 LacI family DNA-binding transcriptional regulator [Streptomyces sp. DSM 44938]